MGTEKFGKDYLGPLTTDGKHNTVVFLQDKVGFHVISCLWFYSELQIRGGIEDNSKVICLISQRKHML